MPEENVELVRRSMEAFARGDLEEAFAAHDPERTEWRTAGDEPDPRSWKGIDGLRDFAATMDQVWQNRFEGVQEFEDLMVVGDWVVCPWRAVLTGRGSGVEVVVEETYAVLVSGGRIVRVVEYRTTREALDAVRSRPQG